MVELNVDGKDPKELTDEQNDFKQRAQMASDEIQPILDKHKIAIGSTLVYGETAITCKPVYADNKGK